MSGPGDGVAKTRYISCTPLLGSDDQVGVWMVVMVENETVTGSLPSRTAALNRSYTNHTTHTTHTNDIPVPQMPRTPEAFQLQKEPQYPTHHHHHGHGDSLDSDAGQRQRYERNTHTSSTIRGAGGGGSVGNGNGNGNKRPGSEGGRLYAEFMRNQSTKKSAEEWKGDYLSGSGNGGVTGGDGDAGRFEEVGSP